MNALVNSFVWPFTCAVSFRVVWQWERQWYTCQFVHGMPKLWYKELVTVRHNVMEEAIFTVPVIKKTKEQVLQRWSLFGWELGRCQSRDDLSLSECSCSFYQLGVVWWSLWPHCRHVYQEWEGSGGAWSVFMWRIYCEGTLHMRVYSISPSPDTCFASSKHHRELHMIYPCWNGRNYHERGGIVPANVPSAWYNQLVHDILQAICRWDPLHSKGRVHEFLAEIIMRVAILYLM